MPLKYGNQGNKLGAKQQALVDKLMATEVNQKTNFNKFATITKALPQNVGKTMKFRKPVKVKDLMLANKIYKKYLGSSDYKEGQGIATLVDENFYQNFILAEGESGDERSFADYIEVQTDVFPIGFWSKITEEVSIFHDLWTLGDYIRELSETGAFIIDGFYRDLYMNSAGHSVDISGDGSDKDNMKDSNFTDAVKKTSMKLRLSGAKYVNKILDNSPNYGTIPLNAKYIAIVNPLCEFSLRDNADFIPVENYPNVSKVLDNEIGTLKDFRFVFDENMLTDTDSDGNQYGYALIMGQDHTADIPIKGKNRIETITKGLGTDDKSDPLNRFQIIGFKSWLGACSLYPERIALIKAKITY